MNAVDDMDHMGGGLDRAPCGYLVFTDQGLIIRANYTLGEMLGLPADSLAGHSIETILTIPSRIFYQTHFFPLLKIQGEVSEVYLALRSAKGELPVLVNAVRREIDGFVHNEVVLVVMRQRGDYENALLEAKRAAETATQEREEAISRLELAHEELQAQQEELERLNMRLNRSMTETHHRVKNNLQVLSALIDMQVGRGLECVPTSELVRMANHIQGLAAIHDMLTHESKKGSDVEYLSILSALRNLHPLLGRISGGRAVEFDVEDASLPMGQVTSLAALVSELVSNATKHGQGLITLSFQVAGEQGLLEVSDDGPGFPPEFDPVTSSNTGIELVQSLVTWDLRGQIDYRNRPEGGACVVVQFPLTSNRQGG